MKLFKSILITSILFFNITAAQAMTESPVDGREIDPDNVTIIAKYSVSSSGEFLRIIPARDVALEKENTFKKLLFEIDMLLPLEAVPHMKEIWFIADKSESAFAAVEKIEDTLDNWALLIDESSYVQGRKNSISIEEFREIMIHEFGHLITLAPHQFEREMILTTNVICSTFLLEDGCVRQRAYINIFRLMFWDDIILKEWNAWDNLPEKEKERLADELCKARPSEFLTDYACSDQYEDIAESWTIFVIEPPLSEESTAGRKGLFFYYFPELVELRNQIRKNL